jgi:Iron-containing redox enzyme
MPDSMPPFRPVPAPATSRSERLRRKVELVLPVARAAGERLLTHPRIADLYAEYLFLSHCVVRASVPLMWTALRRVEELAATDGIGGALRPYLERHIAEERDHDEWLLQDLESLGIARSSVLPRPPSAAVASLVGAQYYWVLHYHPVALLGYMAVLEWNPPSRERIDDLVARTGHPRRAFRTLAEHASLDPHHAEELRAVIDSLPLRSEQAALLGLSALHTVAALAAAFDEVGAG